VRTVTGSPDNASVTLQVNAASVFDVPEGYTANSTDGMIVDNVCQGDVPEPSVIALLGPGGLGFLRRRPVRWASPRNRTFWLVPAKSASDTSPMKALEQWDTFEAEFSGPAEGNPFVDVEFSATFALKHRRVRVDGFYDGGGVYRVRFMPDAPGEWTFITQSNHEALDGLAGGFAAEPAQGANHGPVGVVDRYHFAYADGTGFSNIGTTCYAWAHQEAVLIEQTLETLASAPFNKLRMCVLPKHYRWNENEPPHYPFPLLQRGSSSW